MSTDPAAISLVGRRCRACAPGEAPLATEDVRRLLAQVDGWTIGGDAIARTFRFSDYAQTMAFVNAVAWIAQREDHHPDLSVGYDRVRVEFSTHSIGGLSMNDFICAAKVDALIDP